MLNYLSFQYLDIHRARERVECGEKVARAELMWVKMYQKERQWEF